MRILGHGLGAEIGAAIGIELEGEVYAPLHDHNGNLVALVNKEGTVAETYRYSAFGEQVIYNEELEPVSESVLQNPWRFSSKRQEADFTLFGRRFYIPELGRWLTPDPVGREAGPNLYAYLNNSPLNHFDLYGFIGEKSSSFLGSVVSLVSFLWEAVKSIVSSSAQKVRTGISYVGTGMRLFSEHVIPIPFIKDIGCMAGHFLENGSLNGFTPDFQSNNTDFYYMDDKPELKENIAFLSINGICTPTNSAISNSSTISEAYGGINVHSAYNGTNGFVGDILESIAQKLGIRTYSVEKAVSAIRYCIGQVGGKGSGGIVKIDAHSQGGLILNSALQYLTKEERSMICASTYGSAKLISDKGLKSCINYVSKADPVPIIGDFIGYISAKLGFRSNVRFLKPLEKGLEHGIGCKTYQAAMAWDRQQFNEKWIN